MPRAAKDQLNVGSKERPDGTGGLLKVLHYKIHFSNVNALENTATVNVPYTVLFLYELI